MHEELEKSGTAIRMGTVRRGQSRTLSLKEVGSIVYETGLYSNSKLLLRENSELEV